MNEADCLFTYSEDELFIEDYMVVSFVVVLCFILSILLTSIHRPEITLHTTLDLLHYILKNILVSMNNVINKFYIPQ